MQPQGISVVMPAYNAELFIQNSIKSLQNQTFENWELIVVDDSSNDSTPLLVEEFASIDTRIQLVKLKNNFGGPAGPRNIGIEKSQHELIAFLDSDDIWHPRKLELQIKTMTEYDCKFCCSSMVDFYNDAIITFPDIQDTPFSEIDFRSQSLRAKIPASSVLLSKALALEFPFQESIEYKAVEDFHCWLRILETGEKCIKIQRPLLFYRKSPGQISGSKLMMMQKVFMVHRSLPSRNILSSLLLTVSHVLGGLYFRLLKQEM